MEIRKLNAARGWVWVKQGYQLIMRNPLLSIPLALIGTLIMFVAFKVPVVGPLLVVLLMPVVMAGYMRVCRSLEEDEEVELAHLFEGFHKRTSQLVALGSFAMLGMIITSIAMLTIGGEAFGNLMENMQTASDPEMMMDAMWSAGSGVALSMLVGLALMCVLMMAFQYAPMLVFFHDLAPFAALRTSLTGSLRNLIPYTVYSLIMQLVGLVFSVLPFDLGLIVLLPLGFTSLYVSYRNIFPFAGEIPASPPEISLDASA